jgi:AcrR family transcriptional regulator
MMVDNRRRRTASDQVSAALLGAAEAVLDREGAKGVTVRAVAREADVAPMGVYNRFDNKEGLLAELAMRALDELAAAIDVPTGIEPAERFRRACRGYREFALRHPARYSLIFTAGSPLEDTSSSVAARGRMVFDVLVDLVRGLTSDGATPDPVESAQTVWSAVHGAVTIEQANIGQTRNAATSFEHMLGLLVEGISTSR